MGGPTATDYVLGPSRAQHLADVPGDETRRRRRRGDVIALGVLIGVPLLVFAIPAAVGYPLLTGDNVIQNYPLRVLAGEILAHGHLPIYNPFAWSGTPLLASSNATVAFPDIALFAFLPGIVAWVGVEVIAFGGAAVGLYCFLRCEGLEPLPAGIGGALYGLGGYVSSQAVHLDVVQTAASLAWVLVALQRVGRGAERHLFAWTAFLAAAVAAAGLSANPESEFYAALGAGIYAISLVISGEHRLRSTALIILGAAVGALIASVQIIPADRFVDISQRAAVPFSFLTQGSVRPAELSLVVLPHLLGGGLIGLRHYVGGANLAEIDVYPGLVALAGVLSLAFSLRSPNASRIVVWYLIGTIGLLVALGPATFLPHVLRHLPVVARSRLPSRALVLPAASFAVLGGVWSAEFLEPGSVLPKRADVVRSARMRIAEKWSVLVPSLAVFGLAIAVAVAGRPLAGAIAGRHVGSWTLAHVAPYLGVSCALALVAGVVFGVGPRLSRNQRSVALVAVVSLDLLLFTANQTSLAPIRSKDLGRPNRYEVALRRVVGAGRFVVVDHGRGGQFVLNDLGAPNLNVFFEIPSAQGYGSLTWGPYAAATGTHDQDTASPSAFATTVFDSLDVRALLALPSSFESGLRRPGDDRLRVRSSSGTTRYFGGFVDVRSICVDIESAAVRSITEFESRVRFVDGGDPAGMRFALASCGVDARLTRVVRSIGITFPKAPPRVTSIEAIVTTAKGRRFGLDGPLSASVTSPHWVGKARIGPYFVFRDASADAPFTGLSPKDDRPIHLVARVVSSSPWTPTETVSVTSPRRAVLVRDVADLPGWIATIDHGGRESTVTPERDGVVQAIAIPKGTSIVTYRYHPPGLSLGEGLAAGGALLVLLLLALDRRSGRTSARPGRRGAPPAP